MNKRITVIVERRTPDPDSSEPWEVERAFTYDPSALTFEHAVEIAPSIAAAIRILYITSDYLAEWLKPRLKEAATEK